MFSKGEGKGTGAALQVGDLLAGWPYKLSSLIKT